MGVLANAALPRAVGIGEIDAHLGPFRQAFVLSHLATRSFVAKPTAHVQVARDSRKVLYK